MLTELSAKILGLLDENSGFATGDIANIIRPLHIQRRKWSLTVRRQLLDLREAGLVDSYDDGWPILWKRTAKGTEALTQYRDGAR